jgi:serine/threonine protein kinase
MMVGTASYLAPEQVAGEPVGPATDVYALGLVLLEALTGTREYDGPAIEAAMARLHRSPVMPATLPSGWAPVLSTMTTRDVTQRPSAHDVAQALRSLRAGGEATTVLRPPPVQQRTTVLPAATAAPAPVAAPRATRSTGPSRAAWVVVALIVVVALGAVGWLLANQSSPSPRQIPAVSPTLPSPLRTDLNDFVDQVRAR